MPTWKIICVNLLIGMLNVCCNIFLPDAKLTLKFGRPQDDS